MKIYLAGNIYKISKKEALVWRNEIKKLAPANWEFLYPKITSNIFESINFDKFLINQADVVLAKINETPSWGTAMEIFYANQLGKLVIAFTLEDIEIHGWVTYHCVNSLRIKNLQEVVDYIKSLEEYQR